nr:transposase (putative), gypsy type [Tanacetum cinerariifolium]
MSFSKRPGKNTPQCYTKPLDSLKNWNNRFFWVDERVFSTVMDWRTNASKDGKSAESTYSIESVRALDTHRTPIQKQPKMLLCLVGISRRYYLGDEICIYFQFDSCPKFEEGEDWKPPTRPHEVPLLTLTATRVIEMDDPAVATDSSGVPSTIERSPLDFAHETEASDQGTAASEMPPSVDVPASVAPGAGQAKDVAAADPPAAVESWKKDRDADVAQSFQGIAAAGDPESENASSPAEVGSPEGVYRPEWGVTNARQVAIGSQLRLRFEQEAKLLRKFVAQVARQDKRIQARELEIKNLEALLEAEANTKKAAEDRSAGLSQKLENMRRRWVIGRGLRLAVMKCDESLELRHAFADAVSAGIAKGLSEGLRHGLEHGQAQLSLESIKAYDPEAEAKFVASLQALKDLKYPLVDQLESLKDAPMDVIMAAMYLESNTGDDAP